FTALSLASLWRSTPRIFWIATIVGGIAALMMAVTSLVVFQQSSYLGDRASRMIEPSNVRIDLWHAAIEQWKLRPFIGTGSGTYLYYGRQFRTDRVQRDPEVVHNDYLQLLAEYGLIGAFFFSVFLFVHLNRGWRDFGWLGPRRISVSSRLLSNSLALNVGAIAAASAYIVHSFVDFNLHIPANVVLLAFVFGILVNAGVQRPREATAPIRLSGGWHWALPVIGVIVLIQCMRLWPSEYFAERARMLL